MACVFLEVFVDEGGVEGGLEVRDVCLLNHVQLCHILNAADFDRNELPICVGGVPVVYGWFCVDQFLSGECVVFSASVVFSDCDFRGGAANIEVLKHASVVDSPVHCVRLIEKFECVELRGDTVKLLEAYQSASIYLASRKMAKSGEPKLAVEPSGVSV